MSAQVYAWGDNSTPVARFSSNMLYDTYGKTVIACTDGNGNLYLGGIASGTPDYFMVNDEIRESNPNGRKVFTIRGNGICDGNFGLPTFKCLSDSSENRLALALTAISNIGELRFRPAMADVVDSSSYSFGPKKSSSREIDYEQVNGNAPDPFSSRPVPVDLANRFGTTERSESFYRNIQNSKTVPTATNKFCYTYRPTQISDRHEPTTHIENPFKIDTEGFKSRCMREAEEAGRFEPDLPGFKDPKHFQKEILHKYGPKTTGLTRALGLLIGIPMVTILPFVVGLSIGVIFGVATFIFGVIILESVR